MANFSSFFIVKERLLRRSRGIGSGRRLFKPSTTLYKLRPEVGSQNLFFGSTFDEDLGGPRSPDPSVNQAAQQVKGVAIDALRPTEIQIGPLAS